MQLNHDNYFSPEAMMEYMSTSQFKSFEKCEAAVMAELYGLYKPETKNAILRASYLRRQSPAMSNHFLMAIRRWYRAVEQPRDNLRVITRT